MPWHQFRYVFTRDVESAMRYSIHEALRRQCQSAGGGTTEGIANDAIETFKRKMEKHTGSPLQAVGHTEVCRNERCPRGGVPVDVVSCSSSTTEPKK